MKKSDLIETLENLPDTFTEDELIDKVLFVKNVKEGLSDIEEGKITTHKEEYNRLEKWLK